MTKLQQIVKEAQKIRKQYPNKYSKWTDYIKAASKQVAGFEGVSRQGNKTQVHYSRAAAPAAKKKAVPAKKAAPKKAAVKKAAPKKAAVKNPAAKKTPKKSIDELVEEKIKALGLVPGTISPEKKEEDFKKAKDTAKKKGFVNPFTTHMDSEEFKHKMSLGMATHKNVTNVSE